MGDPSSDQAAPKSATGLSVSHPAVTGGAGVAAGGVFSFALLTEMGMKGQLANAHSTFAFICAVTVLCILILACLLVGYMTMTRGAASKAPPAFWAGMVVFAVISAVGLTAIVIDYFRNPAVDVQAYLEPNSDLSALGGDPPLSLAVYLQNDAHDPLTADRSKPRTLELKSGDLILGVGNLDSLKAQLKSIQDLRNEEQGGQAMRGLFLQACAFVPSSNELHQQCQTFQSAFQQ
ncbi:MAG: hypothetical protein ACREHE_03520 [Rhizomicrobium sp.]